MDQWNAIDAEGVGPMLKNGLLDQLEFDPGGFLNTTTIKLIIRTRNPSKFFRDGERKCVCRVLV